MIYNGLKDIVKDKKYYKNFDNSLTIGVCEMEIQEQIKWINALIQHKNIKAFYNSSLWIQVRDEALERDNYECQKCKAKGLYNKAQCVHHKKHVRKHPELALTLGNTVSLCNSCHDEEHPEKLKHKPKQQLNIEKW